jgi:uncharacterized protein DUF6582
MATIEKRQDVYPNEGERKYGDVQFADPTNKKYPIDTEEHVRAAWSYIHMPRNAGEYDAKDLETIKNRIRKAAEGYGIELEAN